MYIYFQTILQFARGKRTGQIRARRYPLDKPSRVSWNRESCLISDRTPHVARSCQLE